MGGGFTSLALTGMLAQDGFFNKAAAANSYANPLAPREPQLPQRAKSVIFLFMYGGPSHVDTFEYKPKLYPLDGKTIEVKTFGRGGRRNGGRVVGPKWDFHQHGQCGKHVSTLFPHLSKHVDDMAFIHSMTADSPIHGSAMLMMNCGSVISGKPSLGSWVNYGLGSVTRNCVTMWRRLAPSARRMPISRVRSVTVASITFMMPMPPTSRLMPAIEPSTMLKMRFVSSARASSSSGTTTS